jgi:hypothetical protein
MDLVNDSLGQVPFNQSANWVFRTTVTGHSGGS